MRKEKIVTAIWKGVKGFFSFWKDFLVGDSPVLALGVVVILGVAYLLRGFVFLAPVTTVILVLALLVFTIWQKARARRHLIQH
jgi:hypothetical protein